MSVAYHNRPLHVWATVLGTTRAYIKRSNAYLIDIIRTPIFPLMYFLTWRVTYSASGQHSVEGTNVSGFLLVGMIAMITWSSTIWSSGYAIEDERWEGTVAALFLSPASRAAVVAGAGLGSLIWLLPSFLMVGILGVVTGARFDVASPLAVVLSLLALLLASIGTGFAFSGLFVLSRRANLLANFLQTPIYLLAGFIVPRDRLPSWVHAASQAIPVSHAVDALRASTLAGKGLGAIWPALTAAVATTGVYALIGVWSLRRVEYAAKRSGQLELY